MTTAFISYGQILRYAHAFFSHYLLIFLPLGPLPTMTIPVVVQTLGVEQLSIDLGEKVPFMLVTSALIAKNIVIKGWKISIM